MPVATASNALFELATEDTAPVAGSTVGKYSWATARRIVTVRNATGQRVHLNINSVGAFVGITGAAFVVLDGATLILTERDIGTFIRAIDIFVETSGTVANLSIQGIDSGV